MAPVTRSRRRAKRPRAGVRGWITLLLVVLLGLFGLSFYLGYLGRRPPRGPVQSAVWEVPPSVVPDAGSPTLVVWNGCGVSGLGERVSRWLRRQGFDVYETCNADRMDYRRTLVVTRSQRPEAARAVAGRLKEVFGVGMLIRQQREIPEADVLLILGRDFPDSVPTY